MLAAANAHADAVKDVTSRGRLEAFGFAALISGIGKKGRGEIVS
jgi:hypothetical protein